MSTYAYHEFRAIDQALSPQEQEEVASLSSRADVSAHYASFVYHYSSFRGDEQELLTTCFDAMFFIASWGTIRLVFSLPKESFEIERAAPYLIEDIDYANEGVSCEALKERVLLTFALHEMELGWIEGQGWLEPMLALREHLLMGDDRTLYLGWLASWCHGAVHEDEGCEPPIPAGLGQLEEAHRAFARLFQIPETALAAAAEKSSPPPRRREADPMPGIIGALSLEECQELLLRVAQGEQQKVHRELRRRAVGELASLQTPGRTLGELSTAVEGQRTVLERRAHDARLNKREKLQEFTWRQVEERLTGSRRNYKHAARDLALLLELAQERGCVDIFMLRVQPLLDSNRDRITFVTRMQEAGLGHLL